MRNCAQADVNVDTGNLIFAYTKLNQQLKKMVSELTNIRDYQEIVSKTGIVVNNPALTMLPCNSVCS